MGSRTTDKTPIFDGEWLRHADPYEVALSRANFLKAMLAMACGEGGETLRRYNDQIQDDYMAAASEFADQLREALDAIPEYDRWKAATKAA